MTHDDIASIRKKRAGVPRSVRILAVALVMLAILVGWLYLVWSLPVPDTVPTNPFLVAALILLFFYALLYLGWVGEQLYSHWGFLFEEPGEPSVEDREQPEVDIFSLPWFHWGALFVLHLALFGLILDKLLLPLWGKLIYTFCTVGAYSCLFVAWLSSRR